MFSDKSLLASFKHNNHHQQNDNQSRYSLESSWTVWFLHRGPGVKINNYLLATKQISTFSTVQEFWNVYSHLRRVDKLPFTSEYQIFRKGVLPMWEDPLNAQGGKWVVRFKRQKHNNINNSSELNFDKITSLKQIRYQSALYWENLILALIGGSLQDNDQILGIVISVRRDEDILSIWTRQGEDEQTNDKILGQIQQILGLQDCKFEYKIHAQSKEGAERYNPTNPNNPL